MPVEAVHDRELHGLDVPDGDSVVPSGRDGAYGDFLRTVELDREIQARHGHELEHLACGTE